MQILKEWPVFNKESKISWTWKNKEILIQLFSKNITMTNLSRISVPNVLPADPGVTWRTQVRLIGREGNFSNSNVSWFFRQREQRRQENDHKKENCLNLFWLIDVFLFLIKSIFKIFLFYWINQLKRFKDTFLSGFG